MPESPPRNVIDSFFQTMYNVLNGPATFFKENIVEPNQKHYPWYHQKFRRVATIDQCDEDDIICCTEANMQFKRDKLVDSEILFILRQRFEDCVLYERPDHVERCQHLLDIYKEANTNWFIKYGDLGGVHTAKDAFMKQKHRMIWERRHGPVGTGMKQENGNLEDSE